MDESLADNNSVGSGGGGGLLQLSNDKISTTNIEKVNRIYEKNKLESIEESIKINQNFILKINFCVFHMLLKFLSFYFP